LLAQSAEAVHSGRRFELAELSSPMSVEALCALAGTSVISSEANGWSGSNLSGFSDPDFDAACERVQASLPGMPDYTASRQTVLSLFAEQVPVWPLFYQVRFTLARPDLAGIQTGFGQASELQNIESFRLEP
jgi:ABC-type oligopeptide transport system substrate-binding subunit